MSDHLQTIPDQKNILIHFDQNDPVMAQVIRRIGPLKLKRNRNYFVVLCKAIVAQQISVAAADTITGRFQALFAGSAPTPERVLKLSDAVLRGVGLSRQKVAYLKDLSCYFHERAIRPHRLHYMDNEEVIRQLTAVHGIGRWTAEMFQTFLSIGTPDFSSSVPIPPSITMGSPSPRSLFSTQLTSLVIAILMVPFCVFSLGYSELLETTDEDR